MSEHLFVANAAGGRNGYERQLLFDFQRQVRSLLAILRSLVRRMAESTSSVEDFAAHLEGRIGALARIQGLLLRTSVARVDLEELVREEFLAQSVPEAQFLVSGPAVRLTAREAGTLGLALHELLINSIKFGALASGNGHLSVSWNLPDTSSPAVMLEWCETAGRPLPAIDRRGVGFELIERTLPYELGGTSLITLQPDGLHCSIAFALPPQE